jgi:hypothetical protein
MQKNKICPLTILFVFLTMLMNTNIMAHASNTASSASETKSFEFTPVADTYINEASAAINFGMVSSMRVDVSPTMKSYLRFDVKGLGGKAVKQARLLVYANSSSDSGLIVQPVLTNDWNELTSNYTNAPALGSPLASSTQISAETWVTIDVTPFITGEGIYSLGLSTAGLMAIGLRSRESGLYSPRLVVTVNETNSPSTLPTSTNIAPTNTPAPTVTAEPVTTLPSPTAVKTHKFSLMIPAYFYPGVYWDRLIQDGKAGDIVIANPSNGPGTSKDPLFTSVFQQANNKNIKVAGYIITRYGTLDIAIVKNEIDQYFNLYGITNLFFDEVSAETSEIPYYRDLYQYVKQRGGLVILNPGAIPDELYMSISDIVMVVETTNSNYIRKSFPTWIAKYPASRFAHLIFSTPEEASAQAIGLAKRWNAGYVYVTNDDVPNPFDTLPPYWSQEIAQIHLDNAIAPQP